MLLATTATLLLTIAASPAADEARDRAPLNRSLKNANYEMQVRLDPEARTLDGHQVLTWTNTSDHPVAELHYHLYYNAWLNERSSFLQQPGGGRRGKRRLSEWGSNDWAYSHVEHIAVLDDQGKELRQLDAEFIAPDDGNLADRTVLRVPLRTSLGPGQSIKVAMDWRAKVPKTFARTGVRGDYYLLAQWFPKVGVVDESGDWNCHQFIQTEFFADFGDYDVQITVPNDWVVGATGRETTTHVEHDATTHRFFQRDVHDFAWTTSPRFSVHEATFSIPGLPEVDMRLLLMPDHESQAERYFAATRASLEFYGRWWGPYPYGHITIVDPAYESDTGGMEYPTLFTGGSAWLSPPQSRRPESVTVHEAGHQFWYGLVANNEFEHAWLDEGFNTYSTTRTLEVAFPDPRYVHRYFDGFLPVVFSDIPVAERTASADGMAGPSSELVRDAMDRDSWRDGPGGYRNNAYTKPALMLRTLENHLGWETFQRVLSTYFARYRFRHPKPADFFAVVREISERDLSWFFDQVHGGTPVFDYAVDMVDSTAVGEPRGYGDVNEHREFSPGKPDHGDDAAQASTVFVRRWGDGIFPVAVEIQFEDGTKKIEQWDGKDRWARFDYREPSPITRVQVDPDQILVLDVDSTNNSWIRESAAPIAATKWASKWMIWMQHVLEALAFFA